jgi:leucyl/phenylalanyl-tRNA--protein transferase
MPGFDADDLLDCYRTGVFPMADAREDEEIFLIDPQLRGIIPLNALHIPHRLARRVRSDLYTVRIDTDFSSVVTQCATVTGRPETWINAEIETLYGDLFRLGHAHSVECWQDGDLVGGLYGVSLGGAFFGESMFSTATDASKVALVHLVARLIAGGYSLLDTQFMTAHLSQFGALEIPRAAYRQKLKLALKGSGDFQRMPDFGGAAALQVISQAS